MTRFGICVLSFLVVPAWFPLQAQNNVLMKAMRDEMARSMEELRLGEMEKPYFVAYSVRETADARIAAALGGVVSRREGSSRLLSVEVRVGDKSLDNTNFFTRPEFGSVLALANFPTSLPLGDDYAELRRKIWLATDSAYKQALDHLSQKRAVLQNETRVDEVPDFSVEEPYQYTDDRTAAEPDAGRIEALARDLSAVFQGMPHVFVSEVQAEMQSERVSYLNSEGSSFIRLAPSLSIRVLAGTQADDGTALEDSIAAYGRSWDEFPEKSELIGRVRGLADRLRELREGDFLQRYTGPVLFEGQAAAELVRQVLAPRLLAVKAPLADDSRFARSIRRAANPFLDKLGARVLPRFLSVVDDPTLDRHGQTPLLGGYAVDDEGVPARETALVQRGILKQLLATRNPVHGVPTSTGNRRNAGPAPSNLFVVPHMGLEPDEIQKELLSLMQERELEYGIIVRRIGGSQGRISRQQQVSGALPGSGEGSQIGAVIAYKVFPDGREELVRQAALMGIGESNFRDIVAASKTRTAYTTTYRARSTLPFGFPRLMRPTMVSLVVPSLLFEDVTLRRPPGNIPRPPVVPHPLLGQ